MLQTKRKSAIYIIGSMMVISLTGKVLGLIREVLVGGALGSSGDGAAFNIATAIPRNFLDIAFASAISGCFIPVFNSVLEKKGKGEAFKLANTFITIVLTFSIAVTLTAMFCSGKIAAVMGSGLNEETRELTAKLFTITLPIIVLAALAFSLTGILQSFGEFNIPAAMSIVSNGVIILYCVFFAERYGVFGFAFVFLLGWALQILIQYPPLKKESYRFRVSFDLKNPALSEIWALLVPVMVSTWVMPVNDMVNIGLSTRISEQASVAYSKANVLYSVITGVFVLSVANYIFPELTKINARDDAVAFGKTISAAIRSLIYFLVPMATGLFILAEPLARMVFLVGKFDEEAVLLTAEAIRFFCFGMLAFGLQTILSRAFYARKNAVIPLLAGIAAVTVNAVLAYTLKNYFGVGGPALASSVSFAVTAAAMVYMMYRENKGIIDARVLIDFCKVAFSAAIMGIIAGILLRNLDGIGSGRGYELIRVCAPALAGCFVYFACTLAFRVSEAKTASLVIAGLLKRKRR